jgi:hypothetical protein
VTRGSPETGPPAVTRWTTPPPAAAVVVARWGTNSEVEAVVRALAGSLAGTHRVEVLVLTGDGRKTRREGALAVTDLSGPPPDAVTRSVARWALGEAAIGAGRDPADLPQTAATVLDGPPAAARDAAARKLANEAFSVAVVAGLLDAATGALAVPGAFTKRVPTRSASLPLLGDHPRRLSAGTIESIRAADVTLVTSSAEASWLEAQAGVEPADVGTVVAIEPALGGPPHTLEPGSYVAVVDATGDGALSPLGAGSVEKTAARLGGLTRVPVVAVAAGRASIWPQNHDAGLRLTTRRALQEILAGARVCVCVGGHGALGRTVLESLLFGVPVVLGASTAGFSHVEASGGGVVVTDEGDLTEAARSLVEAPDTALMLGRSGARWATPRYGDPEGFALRLHHALGLGPS